MVLSCYCYDRHIVINQGNGSVLQFTGGICLRVDIGDFLKLKGPLQRKGVIQTSSNKKGVSLTNQVAHKGLDKFRLSNNGFHSRYDIQQIRHKFPCLILAKGPADQGHAAANHVEGSQLHGISLCTGNSNLRACMCI